MNPYNYYNSQHQDRQDQPSRGKTDLDLCYPISPNSSQYERELLKFPNVHFSPTNSYFKSPNLVPASGNFHRQFQKIQKPPRQSSHDSPRSPVYMKSPEKFNIEPIKCEWTENSEARSPSVNDLEDVNMKDEDDDQKFTIKNEDDQVIERRILPTIKNYGTSRINPVMYSNPGIKYPRYSKLESTKSRAMEKHSESPPLSPSEGVRLPSIDSMSFKSYPNSPTYEKNASSNNDNHNNSNNNNKSAVHKDRHQSIMSSTSSTFSNPQSNNKRISYLTTSSLQTSIDGLSINPKEGFIHSIPEYSSSNNSENGGAYHNQSLRFDRPLPLPPIYQNPSDNSSLITGENGTNSSIHSAKENSLYNSTTNSTTSNINQYNGVSPQQQYHHPLQPQQSYNGSFVLQTSSLAYYQTPSQNSKDQVFRFQSNSSANQQLVSTSDVSKTSKSSKESKHSKLSNKASLNESVHSGNGITSSIANYTSTIKFNSAPEEERKYQCKTCGRKFKTSGHVSRHSRIHTGERKHVCPFPGCGARFARHDNCMQHYKTHSNLNGKTAERMRNLKLKEQISTKKMKIKALIW